MQYDILKNRVHGNCMTLLIFLHFLFVSDGLLDKFRIYLESYKEAWDAVRQSLESYSKFIS